MNEVVKSRELRVLLAAVAICKAHEAYLGSGPLHSLIEDSNYEGDLSQYREEIERDFTNGFFSAQRRAVARECVDALEPLTDEERIGAEWLWLRALRWETWNVMEEPY